MIRKLLGGLLRRLGVCGPKRHRRMNSGEALVEAFRSLATKGSGGDLERNRAQLMTRFVANSGCRHRKELGRTWRATEQYVAKLADGKLI